MNLISIEIHLIFFLLITVFMQSLSFCKNAERVPKIAIVGAGIGGTSTAYFLRQLFGSDGAAIDIYEADTVGGRLATIPVENNFFETGGSVIHPRNRYMKQFMNLFGLEKNKGKSAPVALYDGDEFTFRSSEYYLITVMKMLWRYGLGPMKLETLISNTLDDFDRIYDLQENCESYETVEELLGAMSPAFIDALTNSTYDALKRDHFSDKLILEIVEATLRVNYGQDTTAPLFVGSVSVAGTADELFSIKGGNKQVPEKLLQLSDASLIHGDVRCITLNREFETGTYLLNYTFDSPELSVVVEKAKFYDIIVLATPLTSDMKHRIEFKNFENKFTFDGKYHRTVCTIVQGDLNYAYFGLTNEITGVPDIISINNKTFFNSVSIIENVNRIKTKDDINNQKPVWKIFSQNILTEKQLNLLFSNVNFKRVIDWLAYPDYNTKKRSDKFVLHDYIFHVNAIEWAASAMEMSAIGAKNVALLAYKAWTGNKLPVRQKDDQDSLFPPPMKRKKIEL